MITRTFSHHLIYLDKYISKCLVIGLFLFSLLPLNAYAQRSESSIIKLYEWYKSAGERYIKEIRGTLFQGLSPGEREIENQIKYEVVPFGGIVAYARKIDGKRVVKIHAGMFQMIEWISTAIVIGNMPNGRECFLDYMDYLSKSIITNDRRYKAKKELLPVMAPYTFANKRHHNCPKITEVEFSSNQMMSLSRDFLITGSIKLILAHEVAHHVLKHTDKMDQLEKLSKTDTPAADKKSRNNERAADKWAFKRMMLTGTYPSEGMPVFFLFFSLEGVGTEEGVMIKEEGTHPTGFSRLNALIAASKEMAEQDHEFKAYLRKKGLVQRWYATIKSFEDFYQNALKGHKWDPGITRNKLPTIALGKASCTELIRFMERIVDGKNPGVPSGVEKYSNNYHDLTLSIGNDKAFSQRIRYKKDKSYQVRFIFEHTSAETIWNLINKCAVSSYTNLNISADESPGLIRLSVSKGESAVWASFYLDEKSRAFLQDRWIDGTTLSIKRRK